MPTIEATLPESDITADIIIADRSGAYGTNVHSRLWEGAHIVQETRETLYMGYCPAEIVAQELEKLVPEANFQAMLDSVDMECTCPPEDDEEEENS